MPVNQQFPDETLYPGEGVYPGLNASDELLQDQWSQVPAAPAPPHRVSFEVGPWNTLPTAELSRITGRSMTARLTGNSEATFTIDTSLPEAQWLQEQITDVRILIDGHVMYRGRLGASSMTADQNSIRATYATADYRSALNRRIIWDGDLVVFKNVDQSDICWELIQSMQAQPGGNLGIIRGLGASGTGITRYGNPLYSPGASVNSSIAQLAALTNGFDFDISPVDNSTAMTFDIWYPERGNQNNVILEYPTTINTFTRSADPGSFGNALRVTGGSNGGGSLAPVRVEETNITADPAGRWDAQVSNSDIGDPTVLASYAAAQLVQQQIVTPAWTVTLLPNFWNGPNHIWVGDPITLIAQRGSIDVVETLRVYELSFVIDDVADTETVTLTLGAVPPDSRFKIRTINERLARLERR